MKSSFPNLLLVNGPNTTSPWASLIQGLEYQAAHNLRIIRHIYNCSAESPSYALEPNPQREVEWTESFQSELEKLATSPKYGPAFYYLNANGRNTFFWPWPQRYYWWKARGFNLKDYIEVGGRVHEQSTWEVPVVLYHECSTLVCEGETEMMCRQGLLFPSQCAISEVNNVYNMKYVHALVLVKAVFDLSMRVCRLRIQEWNLRIC